jgi:hypothetical protein
LRIRYSQLTADSTQVAQTLEAWLNSQQTRASALTSYYQAIANYNNTLAGWQFAKGTILQYDNVMIADGPLPEAARIRAVDHIRERDAALKIRERPTEEHGPAGTYPQGFALPQGALPQGEVLPPPLDPNLPVRNMSNRTDNTTGRIPNVTTPDLPAFGSNPARLPVSPGAGTTPVPR